MARRNPIKTHFSHIGGPQRSIRHYANRWLDCVDHGLKRLEKQLKRNYKKKLNQKGGVSDAAT